MFRKLRVRFLLIVFLAFLWWLLSHQDQEQTLPSADAEIIVPTEEPKTKPIPSKSVDIRAREPQAAPEVARKFTTPDRPDDLKRISGIGPKISSALQAAGITTYAKLAETNLSELEHILREAGIRIANPETWPEQAHRAANGEL